MENEIRDEAVSYASSLQAFGARSRALKWLENFQTKIGTLYQCPRCAGTRSKQSDLDSIGGGTDKKDLFKCHVCGFEKVDVF
jgi:transcription elongation factor Elf1